MENIANHPTADKPFTGYVVTTFEKMQPLYPFPFDNLREAKNAAECSSVTFGFAALTGQESTVFFKDGELSERWPKSSTAR